MKKSTIKLALRPETLRALANTELARAAGCGPDAVGHQTDRVVCTLQNAIAPEPR